MTQLKIVKCTINMKQLTLLSDHKRDQVGRTNRGFIIREKSCLSGSQVFVLRPTNIHCPVPWRELNAMRDSGILKLAAGTVCSTIQLKKIEEVKGKERQRLRYRHGNKKGMCVCVCE